MSQSNLEVLKPRLVAVDSHLLGVVDDYIQDYAKDCESLAYALNMIAVNYPASTGMIVAIRSALISINKGAIDLSEAIMEQLILTPELEVSSHE